MATIPMQLRDGNPELRLRASELLVRYPSIDESELAELRSFYSKAAAVDTALLACEPHLRPQIALFESQQRGTYRHEARFGMLLSVLFLCAVLTAYAMWNGV